MVWNTGWRARYTFEASPFTLSALARLLAVVLRRIVSALRALPATLNTLNNDKGVSPDRLLAGNCELQQRNLIVDEREARLITHVVLRERRLLDRHFHGVAVERCLIRIAVLQFSGGQGAVLHRKMSGVRRRNGKRRIDTGLAQH